MSAYATTPGQTPTLPFTNAPSDAGSEVQMPLIEGLLGQLADCVAAAIIDRLRPTTGGADDWLDSRHAAEYLGLHRDTLRRLAAARALPSEQDGPGCKLYFRRSDLDDWRRGGGRPRHLATTLQPAA
jgi:excisionase family DNA binding protein